MLLFTDDQLRAFRTDPGRFAVLEELRVRTAPLLEEPLQIPETGQSEWMGYYYCPTHSVKLEHRLADPLHHRCPVDGEVFTGSPYDGSWWEITNRVNYNGAYHLALRWLLTGEEVCLHRAKEILLGYAARYEGYRPHGKVPYNGPGKACPQTINEAMLLQIFAYACDLLRAGFSSEEWRQLTEGMFRPGAQFLLEHRSRQLHNHEVIIASAIAILGLLLEEPAYLQAGLEEEYGLCYQLRHGLLEDAMWFEGALQYHNFALCYFLRFERFAAHTPYSGLSDGRYLAMARLNLPFLTNEGRLPLINDTHYYYDYLDVDGILEYLYRVYRDEQLLYLLYQSFRHHPRDVVEAFFFGVPQLPPCPQAPVQRGYHNADGSGITILRDTQRYLLFKHSPFGGEHDHYDRLGIAFSAFGKRLCADFGTSGYGAFYHDEYFKNTGTHNTVCLNGANQPPARCKVERYRREGECCDIAASVSWKDEYQPPDTFTLRQWDDAVYAGVQMKRSIFWRTGWFAEVFTVFCPARRQIDWVLHLASERVKTPPIGEIGSPIGTQKPYKYLCDEHVCLRQGNPVRFCWSLGDGIYFQLFVLNPESELLLARGPDCPTVSQVEYLVERIKGEQAQFVHVMEAYREQPQIRTATLLPAQGGYWLRLQTAQGEQREFLPL